MTLALELEAIDADAVARPTLDEAVERACSRIAPAWPLDRQIAVSPFWGRIDRPFAEVAAELGFVGGARLRMPRAFYRAEWAAKRLTEAHLARAIELAGAAITVDQLVTALFEPEPPRATLRLITDLLDAKRDVRHLGSWNDFVVHAISQCCAAYFDRGQGKLGSVAAQAGGLYGWWRLTARHDHSPRLLMGLRGFGRGVDALPDEPVALIELALAELGIPDDSIDRYLDALLLRVNGWASWCAWLRWEARLAQGDDRQLVELLAIRLAWELVLFRQAGDQTLRARWAAELGRWPGARDDAPDRERADGLIHRGFELATEESLCGRLARTSRPIAERAWLKAVFCIDVRSEVFRRALESTGSDVVTLGFAGFFGLPIEHLPLGTTLRRPQLPGLLAPSLTVEEVSPDPAVAPRRGRRLGLRRIWDGFRTAPGSGFSFVEAIGLGYLGRLTRDGFGLARGRATRAERAGLTSAEASRLTLRLGAAGQPIEERRVVALVAGILRGAGLTGDFPRLVLLAGHGAETVNNPLAAGLDCGACGGQTGEPNARVLAALLNRPAVREGLAREGIAIPRDTCFLAGLHNTTTDEVRLFDLDRLPASHREDVGRLEERLQQAGRRARAERAPSLGLEPDAPDALLAAVQARARDWSEVRPEWGLAGNAALVVAPRTRTRGVDLGGRAFLHEYQADADPDGAVLEQIMTAPMIVAHWINLQYFASTVDNHRFGSGNKVLHNVVGGGIGLFEGNGGDLRIGLALQSLHDGSRWVHQPVRLHVFIEAPCSRIDTIIARHETVANLVRNDWLFLFQLDADGPGIWRRGAAGWQLLDSTPPVAGGAR